MENKIKKAIFEAVKTVFPEVDIKLEDISLEHPAAEEHGDYSTNIALRLKVAPQKIVDKFPKDKNWEASVAGGFINFKLSPEWLVEQAEGIDEDFGKNDSGKGKKVALEHTNVNPNKALHIGHLRNACIGQSIERLWEANGYDVEVQYYVDDTGDQVAGTVLALRTLKIEPQEGLKFDHFSWDMYTRISEMYETDAEVVQKKQELLHAIEEGNNEISKFTKEVATRILYDNLLTCHWYGFDYDVLIWEGDILNTGLWKRAFEILKKSPGFALETEGKNKGCWVIKDDKTNGGLGGDKVIVRSNGTVIYAGKDIAYHMWKFDLLGVQFMFKLLPDAPQEKPLWTTTSEPDGKLNNKIGKADIVLDLVDVRQTFTLGSVKVALKALGYPEQAKNMHHIGYGIVSLSEGSMQKMGFKTEEGKKVYAMAGRKGIGIMADVLLDKVRLEVEKKFPDSKDISQPIAVAAIKYGMLAYNTFSDIVFDLDHALDISGESGPYLQYTYARAQSVLRKASILSEQSESKDLSSEHSKVQTLKDADFQKDSKSKQSVSSSVPIGQRDPSSSLGISTEEMAVLRYLYRFPEIVEAAAKQYSPNLVCSYLFELAKRFNNLYNNCPIIGNAFRIKLTRNTAQVLKNGLNLLGIEALERM